MKILGLDIGGAHVKSAVVEIANDGERFFKRKTYPFEIWKIPEKLADLLGKIVMTENPDSVAATMTGELSDVFRSRADGVIFILNSVQLAARGLPIMALTIDGVLAPVEECMADPMRAASANWAATARWAARHIRKGLVVDIGSTTTDILPIIDNRPDVSGASDLERLKRGELLYTGYLRTNAAFACPEIDIGDARVGACPEYFAIVGDAHLYLGDIGADDYTVPTPDGGAKTKTDAARRIARIVLAEPEELGMDVVESIARQIVEAQVAKIGDAIERVVAERGLMGAPVILIGPGAIYRDQLRDRLYNPFPNNAGGVPVGLIDPAACCAALWPGGYSR